MYPYRCCYVFCECDELSCAAVSLKATESKVTFLGGCFKQMQIERRIPINMKTIPESSPSAIPASGMNDISI